MEKVYQIKGLDCANCAAKVEKALSQIDGFEDVSLNFMKERLTIVTDRLDVKEVAMACIQKAESGVTLTELPALKKTTSSQRVFLLEGIDCANCARKVEQRTAKLDKVEDVSVNFMQKKLYLKSSRQDLVAEIQKICDGVESGMKVKEVKKLALSQGKKNASFKTAPSFHQLIFVIEGLDCANCARKVEESVAKLEGVKEAQLNFMQKRLYITSSKQYTKEDIQNVAQAAEPEVVVLTLNDLKKCDVKAEEQVDTKKTFNWKFAILAVVFVVSLISAMVFKEESYHFVFWIIAYLTIGYKVLKTALMNMTRGQVFDENFLMALATLGALAIQEYPEAVAVMAFYQIGEYFQGKAVDSSRRSIEELMNIRPDFARVIRQKEVYEVDPSEVEVNEQIEIRPGERVPMDCIVIKGQSMVDTFSITGESVGRQVSEHSELVSGFVNQSGTLIARVTNRYEDSAVSRILDLVENATNKKAKTEKVITRFARIYTPVVVILGLIIALVVPTVFHLDYSTWIYRGMIFLVVSCPCALVLSVPLGYFAGIGAGSKNGILIKGSNYLEALDKVDTIVCDKTGTLTKGKFEVMQVNTTTDEKQFMEYVAYAESNSHHPIAQSILKTYDQKIDRARMTLNEEVAGMGIHAVVDGKDIYVGNSRLMEAQNIDYEVVQSYGSIVYVAIDHQFAGSVVVADQLKDETKQTIKDLQSLGMKVVMLTGDVKETALAIAQECGIDEVRYELLPDQKVSCVEGLGEHVAFVGDGINDAPVLARSSVGISMGGLGSDAAIEASDIVLMDDQLHKIVDSIKLARRTKRIIKQNIAFSLGVKGLVMILSVFGLSSMWLGVFADVGVAFIAVVNSLRILRD
jgi:heavy metal-(Cd/Co/Hg/Pb/Zn)-translocating P-type ATPase